MRPNISAIAAAAATFFSLDAAIGMAGPSSYDKREIEKKPCLNCEKFKQHNNAFCSAECCKEWKTKKAGN